MSPDQPAVWRTARQPRWLALLGVVLVLCVAFGWLGRWQLDVAKSKEHPDSAAARAAAAAPAPLDQVTKPQQVFRTDMVGRPVTVSGTFDAGQQVLVTGKRQGGVAGVWVVTPLRTPSGALVPVVRGFAAGSPEPTATSRPATGVVTVSGSLQPPDAPADRSPATTAIAGTIAAADTAALVNRWGGPIYNVLVYDRAASLDLVPVPAPPADQGGGFGLRNAAYALQWWLFGAFAIVLWWRMVRQDAVDSAARAATPQPAKELTA